MFQRQFLSSVVDPIAVSGCHSSTVPQHNKDGISHAFPCRYLLLFYLINRKFSNCNIGYSKSCYLNAYADRSRE